MNCTILPPNLDTQSGDNAGISCVAPTQPRVVTVDEYRELLADAVNNNDCGLIRAPTGLGKSFLTQQRVRSEDQATIVTNVHDNCAEERDALSDVNAIAFPKRSKDNCLHDEADAVHDAGLDVATVLCPDCPFRDRCKYGKELKDGYSARRRIVTHERFRLTPGVAKGWTAVHEEFKPRQMDIRIGQLLQIEALLNDEPRFPDSLLEFVQEIIAAYDAANATTIYPVELVPRSGIPDKWQNIIWDRSAEVDGKAFRAVVELYLGIARQWSVIFDAVRNTNTKTIVVDWSVDLPDRTMLFDATGDAQLVSQWHRREIRDITPDVRLEYALPPKQIHRDITRHKGGKGTSLTTVAGYIRRLLIDNDFRRLGIVTHSDTAKHLDEHLEPQLQRRIAKTSYFGNGDERASNSWITECDALIILGTYRPSTLAIRKEFVRIGNEDAARRTPKYNGMTYDDPEWSEMYSYLVSSEMMQCIGRARPYLETGIPCYVVSKESLGLETLEEFAALVLNSNAMKLAQLADGQPNSGGLKPGDVLDLVGSSERSTRRWLQDSPYWEKHGPRWYPKSGQISL